MSKVYLSIDLDYFYKSSKAQCDAFFKKVYALNLPIHLACEHHQLLPHMNQSRCDTLINVDWHSDICDETPTWNSAHLNEGTWGNFVSWRKYGTFIWRYPRKCCPQDGVGYCHISKNPFTHSVSGWRETQLKLGVADIPWESVKAVGVCLSPVWIGELSVIQEPITRFGLQKWLKFDGFDHVDLPRVKIF